jgi:DNA-directed RNA polymerase specialized sigma24 family protein
MADSADDRNLQEATIREHIVAGHYLLTQQQPGEAQKRFIAASKELFECCEDQVWRWISALKLSDEEHAALCQHIFYIAYERFPFFPPGSAVWNWFQAIAQERIAHAQAVGTELDRAVEELRPWFHTYMRDTAEGDNLCHDVYEIVRKKLLATLREPNSKKFFAIPHEPKRMKAFLRGIARKHGQCRERNERHRSILREKNCDTILETAHVAERPSDAGPWPRLSKLLDIVFERGVKLSPQEEDVLLKVAEWGWTRTELTLQELIQDPRTSQKFKQNLQAVQKQLANADRDEQRKQRLTDEEQRGKVEAWLRAEWPNGLAWQRQFQRRYERVVQPLQKRLQQKLNSNGRITGLTSQHQAKPKRYCRKGESR